MHGDWACFCFFSLSFLIVHRKLFTGGWCIEQQCYAWHFGYFAIWEQALDRFLFGLNQQLYTTTNCRPPANGLSPIATIRRNWTLISVCRDDAVTADPGACTIELTVVLVRNVFFEYLCRLGGQSQFKNDWTGYPNYDWLRRELPLASCVLSVEVLIPNSFNWR